MSYIDFVSKIRTKFKNAVLSSVERNNINSIVRGDAEKDDTRIIFIPEKHKNSSFVVAMPLYLDDNFIVSFLNNDDEINAFVSNPEDYIKSRNLKVQNRRWFDSGQSDDVDIENSLVTVSEFYEDVFGYFITRIPYSKNEVELLSYLNKLRPIIDSFKIYFSDDRSYYDILAKHEDIVPYFIAEQIVYNFEILDSNDQSFYNSSRQTLLDTSDDYLFYDFFPREPIWQLVFNVLSGHLKSCTFVFQVEQIMSSNEDLFSKYAEEKSSSFYRVANPFYLTYINKLFSAGLYPKNIFSLSSDYRLKERVDESIKDFKDLSVDDFLEFIAQYYITDVYDNNEDYFLYLIDQYCKLLEKTKIRRNREGVEEELDGTAKRKINMLEPFLDKLYCVCLAKYEKNRYACEGIENVLFINETNEKFDGHNWNAGSSNNRYSVIAIKEGEPLDCYSTMRHEKQHFNQFFAPKAVPFNIQSLMFYMDEFISTYGDDSNYYDINYFFISYEIDARRQENLDTISLLNRLSSTVRDKFIGRFDVAYKETEDLYSVPLCEREREYKGNTLPFFEVFEIVLSRLMVRLSVSKKKEFYKYLSEYYPVLLTIINEDLSIKSIEQLYICLDKARENDDLGLISIYESVINVYWSRSNYIKEEKGSVGRR